VTISTLAVTVRRWKGSQNPDILMLMGLLRAEGLRPYRWQEGPNARTAVRSHNYDRVLYCVQGVIEVNFPDLFEHYTLRAGDRIDIPKATRYGQTVGAEGVVCLESRRDIAINLN